MADPVEGRGPIDAEHEQRCRNSIETGGTLTNSGGRLLLREIDELRSLLADSEAAVSAAVEAERAWILALVDEAERVIHLEALDMDEARMTVVELRRAIEQETEG